MQNVIILRVTILSIMLYVVVQSVGMLNVIVIDAIPFLAWSGLYY